MCRQASNDSAQRANHPLDGRRRAFGSARSDFFVAAARSPNSHPAGVGLTKMFGRKLHSPSLASARRRSRFETSSRKLLAMARIYTRSGDKGETGLVGGARVRKDDPLVQAIGDVDELNALIGVARASGADDDLDAALSEIQNELFEVGAALAGAETPAGFPPVNRLEQAIDRLQERLPPLREFILPGGSPLAAHLHHARTVCRRAERSVVGASGHADRDVLASVVVYLNRLSDLLFVLARTANARSAVQEVVWRKPE
jgi:cob(I)alamin adenosyltransferase